MDRPVERADLCSLTGAVLLLLSPGYHIILFKTKKEGEDR